MYRTLYVIGYYAAITGIKGVEVGGTHLIAHTPNRKLAHRKSAATCMPAPLHTEAHCQAPVLTSPCQCRGIAPACEQSAAVTTRVQAPCTLGI